jgi:hypothetical protein
MFFARPKFRAHQKAHQAVVANERWFRKGQPFLGKPFSVKKAVKRHATLINILTRAAKRENKATNDKTATAYNRLAAAMLSSYTNQRIVNL